MIKKGDGKGFGRQLLFLQQIVINVLLLQIAKINILQHG